ncbi:hypothetical protein [Streptomyces jumonjinensis]|uniref:hypothetical protein n=1 Tax=Streptomyces jumonjinensis TaxID=1945 RepID=UPI0037B22AFA
MPTLPGAALESSVRPPEPPPPVPARPAVASRSDAVGDGVEAPAGQRDATRGLIEQLTERDLSCLEDKLDSFLALRMS